MKVMGIGCLLIFVIGVFVVVEKDYVKVVVVVLMFYGVVLELVVVKIVEKGFGSF